MGTPEEALDRTSANPGIEGDKAVYLLEQILGTLRSGKTPAVYDGTDIRSQFWSIYQQEANEYDADFVDKYKGDMDIVLIFSGLFSAVSTSFVCSFQGDLSPNSNANTHVLLKQIIHTINPSAFANDPEALNLHVWEGPGALVIWAQTLMYASIATSLLAALGAVLGKQWLSQYRRFGRGSVDARGRRRQTKLNGVEAWHLEAVLEALPILLQISLLLFGIGLSANLWGQEWIIASVLVVSTVFGFLFYVGIVLSSMISSSCPFRSSTTRFIHLFVRPLKPFWEIWKRQEHFTTFTFDRPSRFIGTILAHVRNLFKRSTIDMTILPTRNSLTKCEHTPPPALLVPNIDVMRLDIPETPVDSLDAPAISWLLETSGNPDVITVAARMVPEVEWPSTINVSVAFEQLRDTFMGCYENTQYVRLVPHGRDRALACGKALLHLYYESIGHDHANLFPLGTAHDIRLTATLEGEDPEFDFVFRLLRKPHHIPAIPAVHLSWMSHVLLHVLSRRPPSSDSSHLDEVAVDAVARLLTRPLPPGNITANALLAMGMVLGIKFKRGDLEKVDKSPIVGPLLARILQRLKEVLSACASTGSLHTMQPAVRHAIDFLSPLSNIMEVEAFHTISFDHDIPRWAFQLCRTLVREAIQQTESGAPPFKTTRCWQDARSALRLSVATNYGRGDGSSRTVPVRALCSEDFGCLVDFLSHHCCHFSENAVTDALLTLSRVQGSGTIEKRAEYLNAISFALGPEQPSRVRLAALQAARCLGDLPFSDESIYVRLLTHIPPSLSAALFYNICPVKDKCTPPSENLEFYEKNLQYLAIAFKLAHAELTHDEHSADRIRYNGLLAEVFDESQRLHIRNVPGSFALYILLRLPYASESSSEPSTLQVVCERYMWTLLTSAWCYLSKPPYALWRHEGFGEAILAHLGETTLDFISANHSSLLSSTDSDSDTVTETEEDASINTRSKLLAAVKSTLRFICNGDVPHTIREPLDKIIEIMDAPR